MAKPPGNVATFEEPWVTAPPASRTAPDLEDAGGRTVQPAGALSRSVATSALEALHRIAPADCDGSAPVIKNGETLGTGGMGIVRLGEQVAVGRRVAVKSLREQYRTDEAILKLLREGWITGFLEHPNIVPVYDIGRDEAGLPMVVFKRIEGEHWGKLMHDAAAVRHRFGASDLLDWNLRIFSQVCNAIHYAHNRGIVHRDLKPENIMIGEFGEVYVLDWGIAVSVRDDGTGRIPLAKQARGMAGTPAYMAPEMLGDTSTPISEQTDVYLLGSILFEIVVGHAPHRGTTLPQIVGSILSSPPPLPDEAPSELARIIGRAMDLDPHARFETAAQIRLAIEGFLQHRGSRRLAQDAERRLDKLVELIASDADSPASEGNLEIHNLYAECRFGFREALTLWRENEAATAGLRRAAQTMIDYELGRGDPKTAASVLGTIDEPPADLRDRVHRALAERAKADREIAALKHDLDRTTGLRTRTALGIALGTLWTLIPLVIHFMRHRLPVPDHLRSIITPLMLLAIAAPLGVWALNVLRATALNRALARAVVFTFVTQSALSLGLALGGQDPEMSLTLYPFVSFCATAMLAITVEPWLFASGLAFLGAFLVTSWKPDYRYLALTASNFLFVLNIVAFRLASPTRDERRQLPARPWNRRDKAA